MDNPQITKIKNLINTTALLSTPEKTEWLVLLDLMNKRQLDELENILKASLKNSTKPVTPAAILSQNSSPKVATPAIKASQPLVAPKSVLPQPSNPLPQPETKPVLSQSKPAVLPQAPKPAPVQSLPKLSHIANLPSNLSPGKNTPKPGVSPELLVKNLLQKNSLQTKPAVSPSPFAAKLREVMAEKEITDGRDSNAETDSNLGVRPSLASEPLPTKASVSPTAKIPSTGPLIPQTPPSIKSAAEALAKNPVAEPVKAQAFSPVKLAAPPEIPKPLPKLSPTLQMPGSKPTPFTPGLNFQSGAAKSAHDTLLDIKNKPATAESVAAELSKPVPLPPKASPIGVKPPTQTNLPQYLRSTGGEAAQKSLENIQLETLEDLSLLDIKFLKKSDLNSLVNKVRQLIAKYGYFDAIFNIEKSPLYKIYIDTGLKLMAAEVDFEQLAAKEQPDEYLGRTEFEKFTDLLTRIQAS